MDKDLRQIGIIAGGTMAIGGILGANAVLIGGLVVVILAALPLILKERKPNPEAKRTRVLKDPPPPPTE